MNFDDDDDDDDDYDCHDEFFMRAWSLKHVIMRRKGRWVCRIRSSQNSLMLNVFWVDVMDSKKTVFANSSGKLHKCSRVYYTDVFGQLCGRMKVSLLN